MGHAPLCRHRTLALAAALAAGLCLALAAEEGPAPLALGSPCPAFSLPGVDGRSWSLADVASARILVLVFTCNHCPTAQAYEGRIKGLYERYHDRSVALLAISPNDPLALRPDEQAFSDLGDSLAEMKIRAASHGFAFPYLYDGQNQELSRALGPQATPHVFIFDRERRLRYQGGIDDPQFDTEERQYARDAIEALLADRPVTPAETAAVGCSVKWAAIKDEVLRLQALSDTASVELHPLSAAEAQRLVEDDAWPALVVGLWDSSAEEGQRMVSELAAIHRIYARRGVKVATVCLDQGGAGDRVQGLLAAAHAACDNYHAGSADATALARAIDSEGQGKASRVLVIAPRHRIVYRASGAAPVVELRRAILELLGHDQ